MAGRAARRRPTWGERWRSKSRARGSSLCVCEADVGDSASPAEQHVARVCCCPLLTSPFNFRTEVEPLRFGPSSGRFADGRPEPGGTKSGHLGWEDPWTERRSWSRGADVVDGRCCSRTRGRAVLEADPHRGAAADHHGQVSHSPVVRGVICHRCWIGAGADHGGGRLVNSTRAGRQGPFGLLQGALDSSKCST